MKRVDFISPAARLEDALKQLEASWMATKESWNDPISQKVEDDFLVPLHGQVRSMLDAVHNLESCLSFPARVHPQWRGLSVADFAKSSGFPAKSPEVYATSATNFP